jgi:hypothetical protein
MVFNDTRTTALKLYGIFILLEVLFFVWIHFFTDFYIFGITGIFIENIILLLVFYFLYDGSRLFHYITLTTALSLVILITLPTIPRIINSPEDLMYMCNESGKNYTIVSDIDFSNFTLDPNSDLANDYGTCTSFSGVVEGNDHTISNLDRPIFLYTNMVPDLYKQTLIQNIIFDSNTSAPIFNMSYTSVKHITFINSNITNEDYNAVLAMTAHSSDISDIIIDSPTYSLSESVGLISSVFSYTEVNNISFINITNYSEKFHLLFDSSAYGSNFENISASFQESTYDYYIFERAENTKITTLVITNTESKLLMPSDSTNTSIISSSLNNEIIILE